VHGILVPGGFGDRGIEGKISAVQYARENGIPFFGICLGMQCAVMEFARNVCGLPAPTARVRADTPHPVIDLMARRRKITDKGRHDAAGRLPLPLEPGSASAGSTARTKIRRTAPAPLRVQQRLPRAAGSQRPDGHRRASRPDGRSWWRLLKYPLTRGLWPASFIPSFSPRR
jgi:hypothetical protein